MFLGMIPAVSAYKDESAGREAVAAVKKSNKSNSRVKGRGNVNANAIALGINPPGDAADGAAPDSYRFPGGAA